MICLKSNGFALALILVVSVASTMPAPAQQDESNVLDRKATELYHAGKYTDAVPLAERALAIREKRLGPNHQGVATALNNLALIYVAQRRYADAEPLYKRALAIDEKVLGPDHPEYATSSNNLAELYRQLGRYTDAEPLEKRALAIREKKLGPNDRNVAVSLNNLALIYERQRRYADAEPLYKRALRIFEKSLGPDHLEFANSSRNLAQLYADQVRYADAEPFHKRALAIREKVLGPDHPLVAQSLSDLASLYNSRGRYAESEPLYKRALAIREKAFGPDSPLVADSLDNLAGLYNSPDRYADAEQLYRRALAIREKAFGPDQPDAAISFNRLALLYNREGRYSEAEPLYRQALAIREKALGPDHWLVAQSLNNLAELKNNQGRYSEVEPLYKRALAIYEKAFGPDHPDVAMSLNNLAYLYFLQRRYVEAEPLYKQAVTVREKAFGPDDARVADSLDLLARLYNNEGRYAEGEPICKRALAIQEKAFGLDSPRVANALKDLALIYNGQHRYAEAEPLHQRALAIYEKAFGPEAQAVAATLRNMGYLRVAQGRYAEAEPLYKRALAIYEKALGPDHSFVADELNYLAYVYDKEGRYGEAESLYKRSLAIREKAFGLNNRDVSQSLNNLAQLYLHQSRYADALPLIETAISNRNTKKSVALPVFFGAEQNGLISSEKSMDHALNVVQRTSRTSAGAAVNKLAIRLSAGSDRLAQLVRKDQDLDAEAEALDKSSTEALSEESPKRDAAAEGRMRERLAVIARERDALQKVFAAEFPDYSALSNPLPLATGEIQGLLSADEAIVVFSTGDEESYVLALTHDGFDWKKISLNSISVDEKVAAFRHGLDVNELTKSANTAKPELFDLALAHELYATLLGPVDSLIKEKRHLMVVPTGALTALPFQLLVTERPAVAVPPLEDIATYRDAAWLAKRQAVSVLPSVANLRALRVAGRRDEAGKPMVGFGDPVFDPAERTRALAQRRAANTRVAMATRAYSDFWHGAGVDRTRLSQALPSLLDTADELKAVAAKLGAPDSDVHLANDASETTVKRTMLSDYRVVYFATHGLVAGDVQGLGEPSLALTLPAKPTELDDGLLTASEVAQLKLNADWVVLSACNTAAGDKPGAEALSGLARAFFYAGARALLVTHWSVDSDAATRLTTSTFDNIRNDPKIGRAEALRQAMLSYMNDKSGPLNAYPGFWGPFALIGEGAAR